jgi:hypothetical protein
MPRLLWQQRQDIGPSGRYGAAMVYMASTSRTLLWGGYDDTTLFGDTWEWDGELWVQVEDTGPTPFAFAGLTFDSIRNVTVFFNSNGTNTAGETWEWAGQGWTVTLLEGGSVQNGSAQYPPVGTWGWDGTGTTGNRSRTSAPSPDTGMPSPGRRGPRSSSAGSTWRPPPSTFCKTPGHGMGTLAPATRHGAESTFVVPADLGCREEACGLLRWSHTARRPSHLPGRHLGVVRGRVIPTWSMRRPSTYFSRQRLAP